MREIISPCVDFLNRCGESFWNFASVMFVQVTVLVLLLLALELLLRNRVRAVVRYSVWLLALVKLVLPVGLHTPASVAYWLPTGQAADSRPSDRMPGNSLSAFETARAVPTADHSGQLDSAPSRATYVENDNIQIADRQSSGPATPAATVTAASDPPARLHWQGALFGIWLLTVALLLAMVGRRALWVRRIVRQATDAPRELHDQLRECLAAQGMTMCRVDLKISDRLGSPAICGLWRPTILLPRGFPTGLDREQIRLVFVHELVHWRRGDLQMNCCQTLLQIVYFYNPAVWLANLVLRRLREQAVDETVLVTLRGETERYAATLLDIASAALQPAEAMLRLIGVVESRRALSSRIRHILNRPIPRTAKLGITGLAAIAASGLLLLPMGQREPAAAAQEAPAAVAKKPSDQAAASARADESKIVPQDGKRMAITGTVRGEDEKPIEGVTVTIHTAAMRVGTNPYCPSCYADCGKRATSDVGGSFSIKSLDPTLVFRVLLVAKGFEPKFVKIDPLKNTALIVTLKSRPMQPDDPRRILSGQVVGPDGKPLSGALVTPFGWKIGERGLIGELPGVDPLAVTDELGRFQIFTAEPVDALQLEVSARGLSNKRFPLFPTGTNEHRLQLSEGATVRGRVVNHGRPVAGVKVGLAQVDRNAETFLGPADIGTDADGRFLFANVTGDDNYFVYGNMTSLGERGGISERRVQVGGDGSEANVGDLALEPAYRLSGRIVLSDGKPLPAHTRVLLSRTEAWDSQIVGADDSGAFVASGIPRDVITISVQVPGYRLSKKNKSLDRFNAFWLKGLVDKDIGGLVVLLEPGQVEPAQWPKTRTAQDALKRSLERLKVEPPMGVTASLDAPEGTTPQVIASTVVEGSVGGASIIEAPAMPRKPLPKIDLPPAPAGPVSVDADVPKRIVRGRVTDEAGQPVTGAEVWLPVRWTPPNNVLTAHAKCADDGHFELAFPAEWLPKKATMLDTNGTLWVFAPGHCIGIANSLKQVIGEPGATECEIRLGPPSDYEFTILLPDGAPAVGARVEPALYLDSEINLSEPVPAELLAKAGAVADKDGRAPLRAFSRDKIYHVQVRAPDFGTQEFDPRVFWGPQTKWTYELTLVPTGRVEGRVLAEQPELFRNMLVTIETDAEQPTSGKGMAVLTVDAEGRFVIPKIAAGWIELYARLADERWPVRPRLIERQKVKVEPGKTTRIEIPLEMAVKARGLIRVKGRGEPVAGAKIYVHFGVGPQGEYATSDAEGRFSAFVLPGDINRQVIYIPSHDLTQLGDSRTAKFPVPDGATEFELPPIEVVKVKSVSGRLLDKDGQPLANCRIDGMVGNGRYRGGNSNEKGEFTLTGVPAEMKLDRFEVSPMESPGLPKEATIETADPLVLRLK